MIRKRAVLWLVLALPALWMAYRWMAMPDRYGYGNFIGDSGDWAAWLLLVTLAATPLRLAFRGRRWATALARYRRDLALGSFAYGLGHTVAYLWRKGADVAVSELSTGYIIAGWLAFALFLPLALTSNDRSVRALGRAWKRLHRLVYPAAILVFLHWVLAAFDPLTAYAHVAILAIIEIARIALQRRQSVT